MDQGGDAPVELQEQRRDREEAFEVAVSALDVRPALVSDQDLGGICDLGVQAGRHRMPAVGGGLGVDRRLVPPPGELRPVLSAGLDSAGQVGGHPAFLADLGSTPMHLGGRGVVSGPGRPGRPVQVVGGVLQFQGTPKPPQWTRSSSATFQRILAMTAAIWHNDNIGAPIRRSLIAYDH